MTKKMNPEIKAQWISALLSGEYEQGQGYLNRDGKFCCLGVLCELAVKAGAIPETENVYGRTWYGEGGSASNVALPKGVKDWAKLPTSYGTLPPGVTVAGKRSLSDLNDSGSSFAKIAKVIEEHF